MFAFIVHNVQPGANHLLLSILFLFSALLAASLAFAAASLSAGNAEPLPEVMVLVLLPTLDIRLEDRPRVAREEFLMKGLTSASEGSRLAGLEVRSTVIGRGESILGRRLCVWCDGDDRPGWCWGMGFVGSS